jgi:hypothetical protein
MELLWYVYDGWQPRIRPAASRRAWMDATPDSFAYRCLPLSIANAHGWEILSPCGFEAVWDGSPAAEGVRITADPGARAEAVPQALFGQGTVTFHIEGIVRTPPGWDLWLGGSPNRAKDGIAPLGGVIETDWSPYTFTMNWRFTRAHHRVRFEENEPFAFFFPVQRGLIDQIEPRLVPIGEAPELQRQFEDWSRSRDAFHQQMIADPPASPSERWQKSYYRGLDPAGCPAAADHRTKLRPKDVPGMATFPEVDPTPPPPAIEDAAPPESPRALIDLGKRSWLLDSLERLKDLSPRIAGLARYETIAAERFLDDHYAVNRPAVLTREIAAWPALERWNPEYLKRRVGAAAIEYQGGRGDDANYERTKDNHRRTMPFDGFIDLIEGAGPFNDAYITAYNSAQNAAALTPLHDDMRFIDHLLDPQLGAPYGMMWIGPGGTFTPLHHDLTNNLLVQVCGSKQVLLLPATATPRLYNDQHVFSRVPDLEDADFAAFPDLVGLRGHRVDLNPGEALFIPLGWWHQVVASSFSVSITYTNFRWANDWSERYPAG